MTDHGERLENGFIVLVIMVIISVVLYAGHWLYVRIAPWVWTHRAAFGLLIIALMSIVVTSYALGAAGDYIGRWMDGEIE